MMARVDSAGLDGIGADPELIKERQRVRVEHR
jgi:hypothetical protein